MSKDKLVEVLDNYEGLLMKYECKRLAAAIRKAGYIHVSEIEWPERMKAGPYDNPNESYNFMGGWNEAISACKQSVERSGG